MMRNLSSLRAELASGRRPTKIVETLPGRLTALLTVATLAAICGIFAITLYDSRQDAMREALTGADNLSAAVTQDIARNIETFDLSLQAVVDGVSDPEVMATKSSIRRMILFDRSATARYLGTMLVLDETGHPVIDSESDTPPTSDMSDRDYFLAHQIRSDLGLYVSAPFVSRLSKEWCIALSRRYNHRDGSFAGVAVGTLRLSYLRDLFGRMSLGRGGSMTLIRSDGTLLMREPFEEDKLGRSLARTPLFGKLSTERSGRFETLSEIDGVRRLFIFRHVGDLPLVQTVGVAIDDIFEAWWRKTFVLGATLVLLCSIVVGLISLLNVQLRRRAVAEAALAELAATDKLTGLNNRRSFDDALAAEWRRGARERKPLSLLMLDADFFKSYNDSYGHLAGDAVLKRIGRCIEESLRRPGDLAARYGGEEFAVLLPNTDEAGAHELAETIRTRVLGEAEPHEASPFGLVSLSIGAAALRPHADRPGSELVAAADAALYASKRGGRNQTTLAGSADLRIAA